MEETCNIKVDQQLIRRALVGIATVDEKKLNEFVASFAMWNEVFKINTPKRIAMFVSQVLHESAYLKATEENLNYSADGLLKTFPKYFNEQSAKEYARKPERIASRVYANRMGNGNESSGDGWKYRGRGYIMLTGKNNYEKFSKYDLCTANVLKDPDSVSKYYLNQLSAFWFWERNNINLYADFEDIRKVTQIINGGLNGYSNRALLYRRFAKEFGIRKL